MKRMTLWNDGLLSLGTDNYTNSTYHVHSDTPIPAPIGGGGGGSSETSSFIQITNQESGDGDNEGIEFGMTGNSGFLVSETLNSMNYKLDDVNMYFSKAAKSISFFSISAPYSSRFFLNADSDNGFAIRNNSSSGYALKILSDTESSTPLIIGKSNSDIRFVVTGDGRVGIGHGTPDAAYNLDVSGKIRACEVKVENPGWCDYVFNDDYKLMSLSDVEAFIQTNHHLPDVPSEAEVEENGIELAAMNAILLKKVEELTLHLIQLEKEIHLLNEER
jgi:hypothetical protein